jgi:hypothetical protein
MGAPSTNNLTATQNSQAGLGNQYSALASQQLSNANASLQPAINYYSGITSSAQNGNYSGLIQAAAPQIGTIASGEKQAQANILQTIPPGAGRDAALAGLPAQQSAATASTLNQTYQQALQGLTGISQIQSGVGLQEGGAGLSAFSSAANTQQNIYQDKTQAKASTMSNIGSLISNVAGIGAAA